MANGFKDLELNSASAGLVASNKLTAQPLLNVKTVFGLAQKHEEWGGRTNDDTRSLVHAAPVPATVQ